MSIIVVAPLCAGVILLVLALVIATANRISASSSDGVSALPAAATGLALVAFSAIAWVMQLGV